jgi:hypothetical protein
MGASLERGKHMAWTGGHSGPHDAVVAHAEETPENDSHMKQIGTWVADLAGHPVVYVERQGKGGPVTWPVNNLASAPAA